tara:strand:- start:1537 stop:1875 length:339 start_codon:yes stop_codon:yes gene_type:complete
MVKKTPLRCQDCKQFYKRKGVCAWGIEECGGPDSIHADECPLFTYPNGYAPLLDCDEDQLPAWYRQKELIKEEDLATMKSDRSVTSPVKKKTRKAKSKDKKGQLEFLSTNLI